MRSRLSRAAEPDVAEIASLIGDPGRAAMLMALLDGRELAASELAYRARLRPSAATAHLKALAARELIVSRRSGRHHFFRLASGEVAHALEALASIAGPRPVVALAQHTAMERLRVARSCYDHLAGRAGVGVTDGLIERAAIRLDGASFVVLASGERFFSRLGIDVGALACAKRTFARACTDWTERRPHVAGGLGAALLEALLERDWLRRNAKDRSLQVTPAGAQALRRHFGVRV